MTLFPDAAYFWFLDHDSFVMNPLLRIEEHVMKPARLESLMMKDHPVVPPDSIIKTFGHLKGQDVDFVLTQDKDGLSVSSFIIRNGEWALFFFETWFDPIYRSYNFQKAEAHALVSTSPPASLSFPGDAQLTMVRNTLSNGTPPFCPNWLLYHRGSSTLTTRMAREKRTRMGT